MSVASRIVGAIAKRAPRWPYDTAVRRGRRLGRLYYRVSARHRRVARANLAQAFPDRPTEWHERVALTSFEQVGRTAIEMLWSPALSEEAMDEVATVDGYDNLAAALDLGRGALLATGHFGNWELAALAMVDRGVPLVSIARPLDDPELDAIVLGLRTRNGARILPKQNAVRGALRALREGSAVAILSDQNTLRHEAVFVPFFGRLAATTPVVAHLHLRSGAPILPVLTVPEGDRYRVRVLPPIEAAPDDRREAVEAITAALTATLETAIRRCPEAWLWMHDRWRERP